MSTPSQPSSHVTGIGGVFFQAPDADATRQWYERHLGIPAGEYGHAFPWQESEDPSRRGYTVWSVFRADSTYLQPSSQSFMINLRVRDLPGLLETLRAGGVQQVGEMESHENGKFAWILDPNGVKVELWEPVDPADDPYLP
ncbi:MAG: VOC family protein [Planctomycetes bacterium]|nr:VOC family protein [Planctomycetota bacterium]MCB9888235.1 VOC family protein [Planctomycetota bacterium]